MKPFSVLNLSLVLCLLMVVSPGLEAGEIRDLKIGVCEDYQEHKTSDTDLRRDMENVRKAGAGRLRFALAWDGTHTGPGEFDYRFWDRLVRTAKQHDVELIPYIGYTPRWLADGPDTEYWTRPPVDYERFGNFVEKTARRYRDDVDSWEIWTEPDNADYWNGTDTEFARMLKVASEALDRVEGSQKLVFGGIAWDVDFLRRQLRDHDVNRWVDVINAHAYYETWHPAPLERLPSYLDRIQSAIDRYGAGEQLWMAEVGYSNYREEDGRVSGVYRAKYGYEHTERHQAVQLFRTMTLLQDRVNVDLMAWYRINDLPSDEPVIGDDNNRYLGLYGEDGQPKPARDAFRFAARFFAGPIELGSDLNIVKSPSARPTPRSYLFTDANEDILIVTWLPNRYEESGGEESYPVEDKREGKVRFDLPGDGEYQLIRFDVTGDPKDRRTVSGSDQRIDFLLSVSGGEIGIYRLTGNDG